MKCKRLTNIISGCITSSIVDNGPIGSHAVSQASEFTNQLAIGFGCVESSYDATWYSIIDLVFLIEHLANDLGRRITQPRQ